MLSEPMPGSFLFSPSEARSTDELMGPGVNVEMLMAHGMDEKASSLWTPAQCKCTPLHATPAPQCRVLSLVHPSTLTPNLARLA